ncbi:hypothetical protein [Melittangium boletus]|uniref:Uncharacterized protein n=1 Tax=Melittangium boletus DSM 14713 TaxID=1294270 RepID=A0A250IE67_9BACT|nr:hypothetical protein [Melittangium boletus]ATB29533.1 hypothetical protein MEBOL_002983 [Melittangium boletus DSM 14713]
MTSRFSRFMHLERPRGDKTDGEGQVELHDGGRFESVEGPGPATSPEHGVPEAHLERFKLHGQTPLVLDAMPEREQRFPRCIQCQTSNSRFTRACVTCGADLQTPEQRADDEARWRTEAQASARMNAAMTVEGKAAGRETERSESEEPGSAAHLFEPSLGLGLLRRIQAPAARWTVLAGALGLPWLLTRAQAEPVRMLGVFVGVMICTSFVPSSFWTGARRG